MLPHDFFTSRKAYAEPGRYNKCVKTGNWFEERALEDVIRSFISYIIYIIIKQNYTNLGSKLISVYCSKVLK